MYLQAADSMPFDINQLFEHTKRTLLIQKVIVP